MSRFFAAILFIVCIVIIFPSCRPKDLEGAFVHYNQGRYDQAFPLAKTSTEMYPDNPEAWYLLGNLYAKKDSVEKMIYAFEKSLSIDNSFKIQIEDERMQLYAKKYNNAASMFNAYMNNPDKTSGQAIKDMETSIRNFKESHMLHPTFQAFNLASQGLVILGRTEDALKSYQELVELYPDTSSSWVSLGRYYFENKDYKTAAEQFIKATEIDPDNAESYVFLAHSYDYLSDFTNAEKAYQKAIELDSEDSAVFFNLGLLYYKTAGDEGLTKEEIEEKYNKAVEYLGKSIELNPDYVTSFQLKGNSELLLKRDEEARKTLEEGVERFPDDKELWNQLATCYARLGIKDKANEADARASQL
jgi:tetratricopeptide (TPR) repeat protein